MNTPGQVQDYLTYERWNKVLEVVVENKRKDIKQEYRLSSFVGWMYYLMQPKDGPSMSFEEWKRNFGLEEVVKAERSIEEEREAARELMAKFGVEL